MKNEKNILIVGLGSIGQRHLNNILDLGYKHVHLVRRSGYQLKNHPTLIVYKDIKEACENHDFDYAIIATPTANHFDDFVEISKHNISNIYIEKPVTSCLSDAQNIESQLKNKETNVFVGYDLHFDLGLRKVKELLNQNTIGNICKFEVEVGQYLPDWRPNEDYRKGMSAKKALGGGVMLDLIHEFDYVNWIFGPIKNVFGKNGHTSDLEIDTEDVSMNILITENGAIGTISLDYLQRELSRTCKVVGDKGTIIWDYKKASVRWLTDNSSKWQSYSYKEQERNIRFKEIIKAFLNVDMEGHDSRLTSINEAIQSLKIVESAKLSSKINKLVSI